MPTLNFDQPYLQLFVYLVIIFVFQYYNINTSDVVVLLSPSKAYLHI